MLFVQIWNLSDFCFYFFEILINYKNNNNKNKNNDGMMKKLNPTNDIV